MEPETQLKIYTLLHGRASVDLWPLHVSPTKKILSIEKGKQEFLLVYSKDNAYDRYEAYFSCTRLVPKPYPLLMDEDVFLLEKLHGRLLGDLVYERLHLEDRNGLIELVAKTARYLALLHKDLKHCPYLPRPNTWREVLEERCTLALEHAYGEIREKITKICNTLLQGNLTDTVPSYMGHGDLHLYQIIDNGKCLYFLDPGGEPGTKTRPGPEYDLATLIRSLEYVYSIVYQLQRPSIPFYRVVGVLLIEYNGYSWGSEKYDPGNLLVGYIARLLYEYYYEVHYETGLEWIPKRSIRRIRPEITVDIRHRL